MVYSQLVNISNLVLTVDKMNQHFSVSFALHHDVNSFKRTFPT